MKGRPRISKTFIVFLIASLFIWALIKLSKQYTSYVSYPLAYNNLPQDKLLQKEPQKNLKILLKGSGFRLISSNFSNKELILEIDKLEHKTNNDYFFLTSKLTSSLQNQIGDNLEIKGFEQDSILLSLGKLTSKKIAVVPVTNITYQVGYDLSNKLQVTPDSVFISGPEDEISKLTSIKTKPLALENVHTDITSKIDLESIEAYQNVRINTTEVNVFGKVDKYTEGSVSIPFVVKNVPLGVKLNTFPKEIEIKFKVALSNFNLVTNKSFVVECDYLSTELNKLNYLTPKIVSQPNFVSSVKMITNKVEFLIQK